MPPEQSITIKQLARLYMERNKANSRMAAALRSKDGAMIAATKAEAGKLNSAYDAARRLYKKQQKANRNTTTN